MLWLEDGMRWVDGGMRLVDEGMKWADGGWLIELRGNWPMMDG